MVIRHFFLFNLTSIEALARAERWYWRFHAPEAVRACGPWLRRYESYRAIPAAEDLAWLGHYNYRRTEMWFDGFEAMEPPFDLTWYEGQSADWASNDDPYNGEWLGRKGGPLVPLQAFIPAVAAIDINRRPVVAPTPPPTFRLVGVVRFPSDPDEADDWFVAHIVRGLAEQAGTTRTLSSRTLDVPEFKLREFSPGAPTPLVWHRWFEFRFTGYADFIAAARPLFAELATRWGVEEHSDLVSTIHLERPDWTLNELQSYP